MTASVSQFTGSIPEYYDRCLGPVIFDSYAADLASRVAAVTPQSVLELAAGTGILTQKLRAAMPAGASLLASDLNQPMLEIAKTKLAGTRGVSFQQADACLLPFPDKAFDCVACQFGVMFFPDKSGHFRKTANVLRPGGRYFFNVWDAFDFNPFARIASATIATFFSSDPPTFYQTPFGYAQIDPVKAALLEAGFSGISIDVVRVDQELGDPRTFADGLVLGNPVVEEIKSRGTARAEDVAAAVARALESEFGAKGKMPLQAIVYSARAP